MKPGARPAATKRVGRRKKTAAELRPHVLQVIRRLKKEYPDAHCALDFKSPFQLLVATILSAQCTDKRVNMVTPTLFARYPNPRALSEAPDEELQDVIRSTGFFRSKTKSLKGMSEGVVRKHAGNVPDTMAELTALPGVGRKTANVVLGNAFSKAEGVVVDTHVGRLAVRLGITNETDPVKVEAILLKLVPRSDWTIFSHLLISHGREICVARLPKCRECVLNDICPSARL